MAQFFEREDTCLTSDGWLAVLLLKFDTQQWHLAIRTCQKIDLSPGLSSTPRSAMNYERHRGQARWIILNQTHVAKLFDVGFVAMRDEKPVLDRGARHLLGRLIGLITEQRSLASAV